VVPERGLGDCVGFDASVIGICEVDSSCQRQDGMIGAPLIERARVPRRDGVAT